MSVGQRGQLEPGLHDNEGDRNTQHEYRHALADFVTPESVQYEPADSETLGVAHKHVDQVVDP